MAINYYNQEVVFNGEIEDIESVASIYLRSCGYSNVFKTKDMKKYPNYFDIIKDYQRVMNDRTGRPDLIAIKGKICIMLIPASVESKQFHEIIVPNAEVRLIKGRVKFKGFNTKGVYVTNKCGQSGSMLVIFGTGKRGISTVDLKLDYSI